MRAAPAHNDTADRRPTGRAGFSRAPEHLQAVLEFPRRAIGPPIISQRGAHFGQRLRNHILDCRDQIV